MKEVKLITDGSCLRNPGGPGGWAAILRYGKHKRELSGSVESTTNNRMEMQAVLEGVRALREPCHVTVEVDSEYVKNGITKWIHGWKLRGWKTRNGSPVKNQDLWVELDAATAEHTIRWVWVRGHANHKDNNRCDALAKAAARSVQSQRGGKRRRGARRRG